MSLTVEMTKQFLDTGLKTNTHSERYLNADIYTVRA